MKKCKWCDEETIHSNQICDRCWKLTSSLDYAFHIPKLFAMLKEKVAARILEIHKDGHF